eukprot:311942-Pleurochrysis_carterae.AAC.2
MKGGRECNGMADASAVCGIGIQADQTLLSQKWAQLLRWQLVALYATAAGFERRETQALRVDRVGQAKSCDVHG